MTDLDLQWLEEPASHFQSRRLFYPCSGLDIFDPLNIFLSHIEEFWFVDIAYHHNCPKLPATEFRRISQSHQEISGHTLKQKTPFTISINTSRYLHLATNKEIVINFCTGRGYDVFRTALRDNKLKLSVFFYRGDSQGASGSGFYWLKQTLLRYVLQEIEPGGLLVSDGSNAIKAFSSQHRNNTIGKNAIAKSKPFTHHGHYLLCIGYLGKKNGPTLAWRVQPANCRP